MVALGFQVEERQMRHHVDQVATALQGAADTSSYAVTAIDCYQAEWEIAQVQGKGQAKQVHCFCVNLATELHEVYGSSHTRQVLAVLTALSMLYKVTDNLSGPTEAAKWPKQLAVNYVQLSEI